MEIQEKQENLSLGILGALLGGILGGAAIVLIGQLGWVSALSGVALAFCTLKGYELLGKQLSKRGMIICIVVMLAVPYLADRITWTLAIVEELQFQFGDAFRYVHELIEEFELQADYWKNLGLIYLFTALGAYGIVKQAVKRQ